MTIIVFLIDTSASMNQQAFSGGHPTLLDVAKGAVETFVKIRQRSPESKGDRYMLLTFEDHPYHIKAGWKENLQTFTQELKNLQAFGMTHMGMAIKNTFDVLNLNRMQSGIDMYGQGRCPFFLEPSIIVCITDGGRLTGQNVSIMDELKIPRDARIPGTELTKDVYRWDQRLFSLVLRLSGTPPHERDGTGLVDSDTSGIGKLCDATGGRSYAITSHRMLMQCVESLVQKIQSGVVINFEKMGPDPPPVAADPGGADTDSEGGKENVINFSNDQASSRPASPLPLSSQSWHSCRKLIYVPRSAQKGFPLGHWPIPEAFWPEVSSPTLPSRSAHPVVKFTCTSREPMVIENLPFDKYELEPSPLTQFILSRKQPATCWQVYIANSSKNGDSGLPFGYLKASTTLTCVNLFVMPYNYPVLLPLLDELFKVHRLKPTKEWKARFDNYLRTMPAYYAQPLRQALKRMGAPNLVPDNLDNGLSVNVINHLKRLKNQAKMEYDRLCSEVSARLPGSDQVGIKVTSRKSTRREATSNPALSDKFASLLEPMQYMAGLTLAVRDGELATQSYRNPFDISRRHLLDQLVRMRANFMQTSVGLVRMQDQDQVHNMAVSQMGNYQDYLKRLPAPLREIETVPVRQHMFGNPFKIDKRMMVDEADIDLLDKSGGVRPGKRPGEPSGPGRGKQRRLGPPGRDPAGLARRPASPAPVIPDKPTPSCSQTGPALWLAVPGRGAGMCPPDALSLPSPDTELSEIRTQPEPSSESAPVSLSPPPSPRTAGVSPPTVNGGLQASQPDRRLNRQLRLALYKEIRRPGRNYDTLFSRLATAQGDSETRADFVREIIAESRRLKRKHLAQVLEGFLASVVNGENGRGWPHRNGQLRVNGPR
ncbi:integrator complex subunit 6-like [Pollicipes pollicipes]|uniref:integrator complex subunit 6-like n=1 Tax=Pollicipes pollicipes TaxID=41117 RepID=UPI0018859E16|nr:integrator complex subunit 6-like [Pollicipes pollicipes]